MLGPAQQCTVKSTHISHHHHHLAASALTKMRSLFDALAYPPPAYTGVSTASQSQERKLPPPAYHEESAYSRALRRKHAGGRKQVVGGT